jgi:Zn-finger nucleic acid-binding protein
MLCPQCEKPLIAKIIQSEEINECSECYGLWLQKGSLQKIIEPKILKNYCLDNEVKDDENINITYTPDAEKKVDRKYKHFLSGPFDSFD